LFAAQVDGLSLDDLRGPLLTESRAGFRPRTDAADGLGPASCTFEVARTLAAAWDAGGTESVAAVVASAERDPSDRHLWAVVKDMAAQLPPSDAVEGGGGGGVTGQQRGGLLVRARRLQAAQQCHEARGVEGGVGGGPVRGTRPGLAWRAAGAGQPARCQQKNNGSAPRNCARPSGANWPN
jgi:hypothetical protein